MLKEETRNATVPTQLPVNRTTNGSLPLFRDRLAFATFLETPIRRVANFIMLRMFKTGRKMVKYENLDESLDTLSSMVEKNSLVATITSHTSHSDIVVGKEVVEKVRLKCPWINNFYIPVAASLVRGLQGPLAQLLYSEATLPSLAQQNVNPLSLVTENDQKKRHMKIDRNELRQLRRAAIEEDSAFLVFAEGSVEGGRHDLLGHERGMQEVTNPLLSHVFQQAQEQGRNVIVFPVGITGTNRMISAENILPTPRSILALLQDWVLKRPAILARATLGHPFEYPNEPGKNLARCQKEVNDTVMEYVALLKPLHERGFYDPHTREYQSKMAAYESTLGTWHRRLLRYRLLPRPDYLKQLADEYSKIPNY